MQYPPQPSEVRNWPAIGLALRSDHVRILISASGYNDANAVQQQTRDRARTTLSRGTSPKQWSDKVVEALNQSRDSIWGPAQQSLCDLIPEIAKHQGINSNLTFGIYQGTFEPSFCYECDVLRSSIPNIIRALSTFGVLYSQKEVYLLEYLPKPLEADIMQHIPASASLELAWLVGFGELIRPTLVMNEALRLEVPGLTMLPYGNQFLLYTVGTERDVLPSFPTCFAHLRAQFSERPSYGAGAREEGQVGVVNGLENTWHVLLHRIGRQEEGALLSYQDAMLY